MADRQTDRRTGRATGRPTKLCGASRFSGRLSHGDALCQERGEADGASRQSSVRLPPPAGFHYLDRCAREALPSSPLFTEEAWQRSNYRSEGKQRPDKDFQSRRKKEGGREKAPLALPTVATGLGCLSRFLQLLEGWRCLHTA